MTERQKRILNAIIREFMSDPSAVGSMNIVTRYDLGVSPATVRNEMVELADLGFLSKTHSSSGRVPTDLGFRFFVQELMDEEEMDNLDDVKIRMTIFKRRFDLETLMREVLSYLSDETGCAALSVLDGVLRHSGVSTLTKYEELRDIETLDTVLYLLENSRALESIFKKSMTDDVCILIGSECGAANLDECSLVFTRFKYVGDKNGYVGVLGPRRMRYSRVIPALRTVKQYMEQSVRGW